MPKLVTVERLIKAQNRVNQHSEYLNSKASTLCSPTAPIFIEFNTQALSGLNDLDTYGLGLLDQVSVHSPDQKAKEAILQSLDDLRRVMTKRARIDEIQKHYRISGLKECFSELGKGRLNHWEPLGELCFLDEDITKIREDYPRIVQFWIDHVEMSGLKVYRELEWGNWELVSVEDIAAKMSPPPDDLCCASVWETTEDHSSNPRRVPQVSRCLFLDIGHLDSEEIESFLATNDHP